MTRSVTPFLLLCVVSVRMVAAQATPLDYRRTSGCYTLNVGAWSRPLRGDSVFHTLPQLVRLDTTSGSRGGRVLSPNISFPYPRRFPGLPRWQIVGDTINMLWSNGFSPTIVRLRKIDGGRWICRLRAKFFGGAPCCFQLAQWQPRSSFQLGPQNVFSFFTSPHFFSQPRFG